ncbi:MAG: tRNA uridine-5-carboxymethylaminomethyl(34) synthesis GTPase MnmE [Chloroflexi bacterium]|nr:tRNA uridine-5-carboxymethylaminomethyl(34) synthesis GTPase MnmE [Chloroflexota bacterium]
MDDTIAAISTPIGEGGIGIVRLSGPEAFPIVGRLFTGKLVPRRLAYGHIVDPANGETVDEVLATWMPTPHTYTREDVVEINCHGGPLPLQRILELVLSEGARLAHPGEFTLRAFLHGRIDLAQAEAVLDMIRSKTDASRRLALNGLQGRLSGQVKGLRQSLLNCLAYLTARIDFPDDEVEEREILPSLEAAHEEVARLIDSARAGIIYRQGVRVALVGRPNVGKSNLLNALLKRERAIVSPLPGTTRDTLEEAIDLSGVPFVLIDTAGIGVTADPLQPVAAERSRQALEQADLVLMVIDLSQPLTPEDRDIWQMVRGKQCLIAANKCDLPARAELGATLSQRSEDSVSEGLSKDGAAWPKLTVSALTGQGLPELESAMVSHVLGGRVSASDELLVSNPRHQQALARARQCLGRALSGVKDGLPDDFITMDLTDALNALGEITGETASEDLLDTIFSQFCVGK